MGETFSPTLRPASSRSGLPVGSAMSTPGSCTLVHATTTRRSGDGRRSTRLGSLGVNLYAYADADPINFIDITGAGLGTLTANLTYDPVTRYLQSVSDPGGETVTYGYDKSLLTSIAWSGVVNGSVLPLFDRNFRLASTSFGAAGHDKVQYDYDLDGLVMEAMTYDDAGTTPVARETSC